MNEVNALIWPNKLGIGVMNPVDYAKTAKISYDFKVIKKPATRRPIARDLAKKAVANLQEAGDRRLRQELQDRRSSSSRKAASSNDDEA